MDEINARRVRRLERYVFRFAVWFDSVRFLNDDDNMEIPECGLFEPSVVFYRDEYSAGWNEPRKRNPLEYMQ